MIHVNPQPEPPGFNGHVRQPGLILLKNLGIALDQPLPPGTELNPYWRKCLDDLHSSYEGICAYLCVFIERVTGGASVDHFVAKSLRADLAYEWSNYRLSCSTINSRKRAYEDVLDPFDVVNGWFHLELVSGRIYPNPDLPDEVRTQAAVTIERLGLDDSGNRELRARHYQQYREQYYHAQFLRRHSPFVWLEARRQALL
ncbi:MAG: hypothetical protein HY675_05505 [Chloroflexi bacterium]|nr:hypothetical protein [Chloroflexota bacterium]